ncbi:MAG: hypothetical protein L7S72_04510, partial [Flavobacteriales bacterium]|nr:hypothetical protein [Flavobacteriales bacterium]
VQYGAYYIAGGNWQYNVKDGTALTFDLEVDGHTTSTGNLGWYAQDITSNNLSNTHLFVSSADSQTFSTFYYRHYSAIPKNSKIRLIFRTEHVADSGIYYTIFSTSTNDDGTTNFDGIPSIVNTSTPTILQCGIWVTSKDLNNSNTSNDISIGSFDIGGEVTANYVAENEGTGQYPDSNHGSVEYLEFEVTQSGGIPGDTVTGISAGGKFIEININMREQIANYLYNYARGKVHYSIEVITPNGSDYGYDLIGGAYSLEGEVDGAFTIGQGG